jgi:hypothetical protein
MFMIEGHALPPTPHHTHTHTHTNHFMPSLLLRIAQTNCPHQNSLLHLLEVNQQNLSHLKGYAYPSLTFGVSSQLSAIST